MHIRIAKLTIGSGTANDLITRIQSDLVPPTSGAPGFIAYYNVEEDASTVFSIRVFADSATLDNENTNTAAAQSAIATDFGLTVDPVLEGDVGTGVAFVRSQVP